MQISKFIWFSICVHGLLLWVNWPVSKAHIDPLLNQYVIKLSLIEPSKTSFNKQANVEPSAKPLKVEDVFSAKDSLNLNKDASSDAQLTQIVNSAQLDNAINDNQEVMPVEHVAVQKKYYATNEVDIKALPVTNIDISMLDLDYLPMMPIKLRLFINENGRVESIERLAVLEQETIFADKIEGLLKQAAFTPARKDNLNVDSFQDVEFSFGAM